MPSDPGATQPWIAAIISTDAGGDNQTVDKKEIPAGKTKSRRVEVIKK